jgi:hypothetical protein
VFARWRGGSQADDVPERLGSAPFSGKPALTQFILELFSSCGSLLQRF